MLLNYLLIVVAVLFVLNIIVALNSSYDTYENIFMATFIGLSIALLVGMAITDESRTKILEPVDVVQTNDVTFVWLDGYPLRQSTEAADYNRKPEDTIVVVEYSLIPIIQIFYLADRNEIDTEH